ncbi:MAG: GTPase [Candidatus Micrarchaeota archaeon]
MGRGNTAQGFRRDFWKEVKDMIHGADVVVEIVDARDVEKTRLPLAERWAGSNRLIIIANKTDLLPQGAKLPKLPHRGIFISAKTSEEKVRQSVIDAIMGRTQARPVKALLIGYPNVGKSTLINMVAKRRAAKVAPVAGTTTNIQWVKISDDLTISDYRGMFPRYESIGELVRKGALNLLGDEEKHAYRFADRVLARPVMRKWLEGKFDIDLRGAKSAEDVLVKMAERRRWFLKGGELNLEEACRAIIRAMKDAPEI